MWLEREKLENRILEILTYIEKNTLEFPLKQNIKLFSFKELEQLLEFLESWKLKLIYILLDSKLKEYMWLIEELKMLKIWKKKEKIQNKERIEHKQEEKEIEKLINF